MEVLLEVAELAEVHYGLKRVDPTDTKCTPTSLNSRKSSVDQPIRAAKEVSGGGYNDYNPTYNDQGYGSGDYSSQGYDNRNSGNQGYNNQSYRNRSCQM